MSALDTFILTGTAQGDPVMGTDTITLAGVAITGVWSGLSASTMQEPGALQADVSASVSVPSADTITLSLVGKVGTVKGHALRCINLDIGEALTTLFFEHATSAVTL